MSSVYCLVSSGDLHFLPLDTIKDINLVSPLQIPEKDHSLVMGSSSSSSLNSSSSTPELATPNKLLETYSSHSVYLPQFSIELSNENETEKNSHIVNLLINVFPRWEPNKHRIRVQQLTGGITNMLLSCSLDNEVVLIRTYGKGTNLIIDRDREFISHLLLNSLNLAPSIFARFANGLVYGYLPGRSLSPNELSHPQLYPLIAQQLGHWHHVINGQDIEEGINKLKIFNRNSKLSSENRFTKDIWQQISDWIQIIPQTKEIRESFKEHSTFSQYHSDEKDDFSIKDALNAEFQWLLTNLNTGKSPVVMSHCDLLSGNIIISNEISDLLKTDISEVKQLSSIDQNNIQFIDYEYMLPAPRGFDIANHLAEWQGFDCDRSKIPAPTTQNPLMMDWARAYLSTSTDGTDLDLKCHDLIDEIQLFFGMPGFYWGVWAAIQSEISLIDFNYAEYAKQRFDEYWDWKKEYLMSRK